MWMASTFLLAETLKLCASNNLPSGDSRIKKSRGAHCGAKEKVGEPT